MTIDALHSVLLEMDRIDFFSVLQQLDDGVIITDLNGTIIFYNQAQGRMDGISPDEALGKKITHVYHFEDRTSMMMQCIYHQTSIKNKTFFYKTPSGRVANTLSSVYPLYDNGKISGAICFVKDYEKLRKSLPLDETGSLHPDLKNGTRYTFADMIGDNLGLKNAIATAQKAAASSSPIMIQGETGTGKELLAQSIHNHSPRKPKKYVAVNCSAIPQDLLEGILFGTTRGAFTGAMDKPGLFETAQGGTLFLDELLSMPVALQAKLLRVLQEKKVQRLGSAKEIPLDIKIISSVSENPRSAVQSGTLRKDLFYRLGVVFIKLPPLRDQPESMDNLIKHFIRLFNRRLGTQVTCVSPNVKDLLYAYHWPGNIRELEHLIEGAMNLIDEDTQIDMKHFTMGFSDLHQPKTEPSPSSPSTAIDLTPFETSPKSGDFSDRKAGKEGLVRAQKAQEKAAVIQALSEAQGNVSRAADTLGISRQLLHYKIRKHGLSRLDYIPRT